MDRKQVITITVEGTLQGLQVKPGTGLDLTQFGNAKVVRASEIVWHEKEQGWMVDVLQEAGRGVVTFGRLRRAMESKVSARGLLQHTNARNVMELKDDDALLFDSYDAAVRVEIAYLDALRLKGIY